MTLNKQRTDKYLQMSPICFYKVNILCFFFSLKDEVNVNATDVCGFSVDQHWHRVVLKIWIDLDTQLVSWRMRRGINWSQTLLYKINMNEANLESFHWPCSSQKTNDLTWPSIQDWFLLILKKINRFIFRCCIHTGSFIQFNHSLLPVAICELEIKCLSRGYLKSIYLRRGIFFLSSMNGISSLKSNLYIPYCLICSFVAFSPLHVCLRHCSSHDKHWGGDSWELTLSLVSHQ